MSTNESPAPQREGSKRGFSLYAILALVGLSAGTLTARLFVERPSGTPELREIQSDGLKPSALGISGLVRLPAPREIPDISFTTADGQAHSLSAWRGKVVLVNLWATWCAPCKEEMPSLDRLQAKLGGHRFTVLAVSTDRTGLELPAAFFAKEGIRNLGLYNDRTSASLAALGVAGLPFSLILDPQGREVAYLIGPASWDSPEAAAKLEEFIGTPG